MSETDPAVISFRPALREVGVTNCPICKHKVKVNLTKTQRPFVNCSFCSVRIFYNGREAIRRLQKRMRPIKEV